MTTLLQTQTTFDELCRKNVLDMDALRAENLSLKAISPLDQFEIRDLLSLDTGIFGNYHISITNIGFYLVIGAFLIFSLSFLTTNFNKLVSNN